ncbi:ABC transporter ATP-binding protein [Aeromicrobium sp. Sec7.5]|uniref:ABC transporter ATP-binding protein n=1 Tax=Aeromicrobium sp. Sec7.5 TaxID=3121276 RepID=UPI002FE4B826
MSNRQPAPPMRGPGAGMAPPVQKATQFGPTFQRLLGRLLRNRMAAGSILAFGVVGTALSVIGPRVLGHATDIVFTGYLSSQFPAGSSKSEVVASLRAEGNDQLASLVGSVDLRPGEGVDHGALALVLIAVMVLHTIGAWFMYLQGRTTTTVVQHMVADLRDEVEAKLHRVPLAYLDRSERGEILSRTTNDIDNVAQSLQQAISQFLGSLLMMLGTLGMMLLISPALALVAIVTIPVVAVVMRFVAKRSQPHFVAQWGATGRLNGHVEEVFTGHDVVKVFGRQAEARETFRQHNDDLFNAAFRAQFLSGALQPLMMFVSNLNYVLVAVVGGLRVASGQLSIGEVQAFIQYSRQFTQPLAQIAALVNLVQSGVASAERVFELLDEAEESAEPLDAPFPSPVRGRVSFEDVAFAYSPDEPLIAGLDLAAEPGETVAIVGPTGAGKTTLANLLLRFYELDGGRITLDGVDIAQMDRHALRDQFGVVLQDTWLFAGTIRENIAYGADDPSDEDVVRAAEAASVDHFVRTLPGGYDTHIDDLGSNISAGQRQLLTIARAFLADPSILVLDEATSSVDTRTEALVQTAMARLRSGRTSFVIAHRLSTIRDSDHIVVMTDGRIVEQGTHDSLRAAGGAYERLYAAQFAAPVEG